jgi:hypothetical protein
MKAAPPKRVVDVEWLGGGIFIQFSNGQAALYSATLLHSMFEQAFILQKVTAGSASLADPLPRTKSAGKPN